MNRRVGQTAGRNSITVAALVVSVLGLGCGRIHLPRVAPQTSSELEQLRTLEVVQKKVIAGKDGRAVLTLGLQNSSKQILWVRASFDAPGEQDDCKLVRSIDAGRRSTFGCPQSELVPGADYRVEVTVYRDLEQSDLAERSTLTFEFTEADIEQLQAR